LMFKGVSQFMLTVAIVYIDPFEPFDYSPLPLYLSPPHPPIFQQLSIHLNCILFYKEGS
jgi:hypothetical protein